MTRRMLILALLLISPAQALTLLTEDYPPFNMPEGGEVGGISSHILREALKRAHLDAHFEIVPWARAQMLSRTQADTCMYSAVRTPEREPGYRWIGPLVDDRIGLFARTESSVKLGKIADAKAYRVGGYVGDAYGDYVERQGVPLDRAPTDENNLPKLLAGRIDLWVAGAISGAYRAMRAGHANAVRLVVSGGDPKSTQMWLACNPGLDAETLHKLDAAVRSVIDDGGAAAYAARYR